MYYECNPELGEVNSTWNFYTDFYGIQKILKCL